MLQASSTNEFTVKLTFTCILLPTTAPLSSIASHSPLVVDMKISLKWVVSNFSPKSRRRRMFSRSCPRESRGETYTLNRESPPLGGRSKIRECIICDQKLLLCHPSPITTFVAYKALAFDCYATTSSCHAYTAGIYIEYTCPGGYQTYPDTSNNQGFMP